MRVKRIDQIEQFIYDNKSVTIDKLCEEFQMSKNTIRRDIDYLAKKGTIQKVYGGVTINESNKTNELISFDERNVKNNASKDSIARTAAQFVEENDTIFIDTGTTTLNMIDYLSHLSHITVITNSIPVIVKALPYENIQLISLPGLVKRSTSSLTGAGSVDFLKAYNITKAFMSCTGLSISNGISNASPEEYEIKKTAMEQSQKHILLADHTKFDKTSLMKYSALSQLNMLITEEKPPTAYVEYFDELHIKLVITCEGDLH